MGDFRPFRQLSARFRYWYEGSLVNRTALKAQMLVTTILVLISAVAYLLVSEQLRNSVNERLTSVASLDAQRLNSEIDRVLVEFENLSRRSLVANGLADSSESNAYLRPFLSEYRLTFPEMRALSLVDSYGKVVASSDDTPVIRSATLEKVVSSRRPEFNLERDAGSVNLHVAFPVKYEATGQVEGVLVGELDLFHLAQRTILLTHTVDRLPLNVSVTDGQGHVLYSIGELPAGDVLQVATPISTALTEKGLPLTMTVSASKSSAYAPLLTMGMWMLLVGAAALAVIMLLTRKMSETIVGPLGEMSRRAMEIAGAGPTGLRELHVTRSDEIGWMGTAFNEMVLSLRQAYDSQEEQVRRRTEELAEARERLAGVLAGIDDVVYAIDPAFQRLEYISPAAEKVFGCAPGQYYDHPELLNGMVLAEDLPRLTEARGSLAQNKAAEVRYRVRLADGSLRWVLDRFHLVRDEQGVAIRVSGLVRDVTASVEAEASLRLRERALASSSCGVVITDMLQSGQPILYVNDAFERITGYTADEALGSNCAFLQGRNQEPQQGLDEIRQAIAQGGSCKVVIRNFRKDGEPFWNELQLSPLHDDSGRVTHYIGIQNDISHSIAATQALVDSEQRLALTIDALHEGVWDWNISTDSLSTSPRWAGILGLDPFEVAAKSHISTFYSQLPGDWLLRVQDELKLHLAGGGNDFYLEHQMRHVDGRLIWVASHGRVVERASDGVPLRMVGTLVDITHRIESSHQIIGLMRQLDAIFTLSPDAFAYFSEQGTLSFVNPAFERMTDIRSGEISGISLSAFRHLLKDRADPAQPFPSCDDRGGDAEHDGELLYLLKPVRRVLLVSRRGGNDGTSAVVYLRDVTRETEVDRMKSEFLSTAAHELRTPMASIMGFAELLMLREFSPERTKDMLGTMHRQARRLTDLINELLDLARIEARAGKDFKISRHPLAPVIRDAVSALHVDGDRSRMQLDIPDTLPEIDIDPAKMQQAMINLLSNAYKYSPDGGSIDISVRHREHNGAPQIGIFVRDHGIGMSPEQTARVFERFFRADPSGNIPGTGLGMSLVKEIMDTHGGAVEIESQPGEGTTVSLWLPINRQGSLRSGGSQESHAAHGELTLWLNDPPSVAQSRQIH